MQKLLYLVSFLFIVVSVKAQQNHFIYIQTENKQPFYVRMDKKVISSSVSGYLIIPRLIDGTYNFTVGFPQNEWPEQAFNCVVDKKDQGFLLKNFGDRGWGFFNLQTLDVTMNIAKDSKGKSSETKTDEFSTMLSTVVNDPSIKQVEQVEEKKPVIEEKKPEIKEEKSNTPEIVTTIPPPVEKSTQSFIKKDRVDIGTAGQEIVYIDIEGDKRDTITVFIPWETQPPAPKTTATDTKESEKQPEIKALQGDASSKTQETTEIQKPATEIGASEDNKKTEQEKETKFLNIEVVPPVQKDSVSIEEASVPKKPVMINSDCKNYATEEDFLKLRKKMVSAGEEDKMIEVAKKAFKTRCFTTDQVKNLGVLFLNDAGKYNFFDAAYPFVSDSHNYSSLAGQLSDPYYINRFKVMIRQ
ncbi:MAG: DUF4476 domain-containing protein [Ferruginibacter sp.]